MSDATQNDDTTDEREGSSDLDADAGSGDAAGPPMRRWNRLLRGALGPGLVGALLVAGFESGAIENRFAEARHGVDYHADPSSPAQLGESVLAAIDHGSSEEFLALFHRPARENCSGADVDVRLRESRNAAAGHAWLPRPAVRSEVAHPDGSRTITFGYDHGDATDVLTELVAVQEDGTWRLLGYPCPEAYRTDQWRAAVLDPIRSLHTAILAAVGGGDTLGCAKVRRRLEQADLQTAPTPQLRQLVGDWRHAAHRLVDACAQQHLSSLTRGLDVGPQLVAYGDATVALERELDAIVDAVPTM